jgi:hypothetical protein
MNVPCKLCGCPVEFCPDFYLGNQDNGVLCESCIAAIEEQRQGKLRLHALNESWSQVCPTRYLDTVIDLLPFKQQSGRALGWSPNGDLGLNLWGYPDSGKTRTLLLVLHKAHFAGKFVRFIEAGRFAFLCEQHAYRTGHLARFLARVDVLAFDDMDKMTLTKHQEKVFFSIIDQRMSRKRPTLFTHNSTARELEYHFRTCGEALTRRLRQFCQSIHFPAREYL